jgi:hypothetical protein
MAYMDYHHCAVCKGKAFYDANIDDPRYVATYRDDTGWEPIGIAVLCSDCNKTHEISIRERERKTNAD